MSPPTNKALSTSKFPLMLWAAMARPTIMARGRQAYVLGLVKAGQWDRVMYRWTTPEQTLIDWWIALAMRMGDDELPHYDAGLDETIEQFSIAGRRADILILHTRFGHATVVEAKDGRKGVTHVAQGIGQAMLYAATFMMEFGLYARPALLWSSTGNKDNDGLLAGLCDQAGVLALAAPDMQTCRDAK